MKLLLRRIRGLLGVGLSWAVLWVAIMFAIGTVIQVVDPASIDQGEEPWRIALLIVAPVGFVSGTAFGALLMAFERRKAVAELSLWRMALLGAAGGAAIPLLTGINDAVATTTGPLGAIAAAITVALARRATATPELTAEPQG